MSDQPKQINFTIVPADDSADAPVPRTYANFCSIAHTPFDFTLTFCEVMPLSEKEIKEAESEHVVCARARSGLKARVTTSRSWCTRSPTSGPATTWPSRAGSTSG